MLMPYLLFAQSVESSEKKKRLLQIQKLHPILLRQCFEIHSSDNLGDLIKFVGEMT